MGRAREGDSESVESVFVFMFTVQRSIFVFDYMLSVFVFVYSFRYFAKPGAPSVATKYLFLRNLSIKIFTTITIYWLYFAALKPFLQINWMFVIILNIFVA